MLTIDELDGVQWIHGDGKPDCANWPEIYRAIHAAGKRIQLISGEFAAIEAVIDQIGTANGIQYHIFSAPAERETEIRLGLTHFGVE